MRAFCNKPLHDLEQEEEALLPGLSPGLIASFDILYSRRIKSPARG
jgi:hypothetical protein